MTAKQTIKSAFESMLFVWGEPLDIKTAAGAFGITKGEAEAYLKELMDEYEGQGRGIRIRETGGGYQFVTWEGNIDYVRSICTPVKEKRLTQAAFEVLAIVAYRQPVTKSEIDSVRGVRSERVLEGLIGKRLIEEKGRSDGIGRPIIYGTTDAFLSNFDLKDLGGLPPIEDIDEAMLRDGEGGFDGAQQTSIDFLRIERDERAG